MSTCMCRGGSTCCKKKQHNEEFIYRNVVGTCSMCGTNLFGTDYGFARLIEAKFRCSCGHQDEWMKFRDYGMPRTRRY